MHSGIAHADESRRSKAIQILGIIPARGGSRGIPHKNIKDLAGKPMIAYTIEAAKMSQQLKRFIVSTDDSTIAEVARFYGAEVPFLRPKELAQDDTPTPPVLKHAVEFLEAKGEKIDAIVLLQPTSPLRNGSVIDEAIRKFIETKADSVVSVCPVKKHPFFMFKIDGDRLSPFLNEETKITRRQDLPKLFVLNGAVYVVKRDVLMNQNTVLGNDLRGIIMKEELSIDIDSPFDLFVAEMILKGGYPNENKDGR